MRKNIVAIDDVGKEIPMRPSEQLPSSDCSFDTSGDWGHGCIVSTACAEAMGLPDNCTELQTLRWFRDNYLIHRPDGPKAIREYYRVAPELLLAIGARKDGMDILRKVFRKLVRPCVALIQAGNYVGAFALYRNFIINLKKRFPCVE